MKIALIVLVYAAFLIAAYWVNSDVLRVVATIAVASLAVPVATSLVLAARTRTNADSESVQDA